MYQTNDYEGMLAETVTLHGAHGDPINAYFARPLGPGPYPGVILIHHLPGWDEWYREVTRKFAHHGYAALSPNLYCREGHGTPEDVAAMVRGAGGVPDDQVVGDVAGALVHLRSLPYVNGKVGVFGTCSGGRHAFLAACRVKGFAAAVDCWGGRVVMSTGRSHTQAARRAAGLHCGSVMPAPGPLRRGGSKSHAGTGGPTRAGTQEERQGL